MSPLLGMSWGFWGLVCLGLAGLWSLSWPKQRAGEPGTRRYMIVRWFHSLTWLMLAGAAFCAGLPGLVGLAPLLALAGLGFYLVFLTTVSLRK